MKDDTWQVTNDDLFIPLSLFLFVSVRFGIGSHLSLIDIVLTLLFLTTSCLYRYTDYVFKVLVLFMITFLVMTVVCLRSVLVFIFFSVNSCVEFSRSDGTSYAQISWSVQQTLLSVRVLSSLGLKAVLVLRVFSLFAIIVLKILSLMAVLAFSVFCLMPLLIVFLLLKFIKFFCKLKI